MNDRLFRSRDDRMLAGVAGGLAEMWDADPSLVRIVWALLVILTGGIALVVYIVMAIVVPEEDGVTGAWPASPPPGSPAADPAASASAAAGGVAAEAPQAATGAAPAWMPPGGQPASAREAARAARHEARAARRAARRDREGFASGGAILGLILIGLGVFFLAREWLPDIDFDWVWPLFLVGIGVVLLVSALGRRPDDPGGA